MIEGFVALQTPILLAPVYAWFTEGFDSRSFISPTTGNHMITVPGLAAEALRSFLTRTYLKITDWDRSAINVNDLVERRAMGAHPGSFS